jgi:uncharacterized protein DUF4417
MVAGIYGTRSSDYWESTPGRFDALNLRHVFASTSPYGIPDLAPCDYVPTALAAWNVPRQRQHAATSGGAIHYFLDDYRFEPLWTSPERCLTRVLTVGAALTPDFSLWREMPIAGQIWNTYRSRWVGAYWQAHGIQVIPTACWSTPDSYSFCFDGIPIGGTVAISALGVRASGDEQALYRAGLEQLVQRTRPSLILSYGKFRGNTTTPVREYPTFWDRRRKAIA